MASESCYYRLSLSNSDLENNLPETEKSSASNMNLILDNELNIQDHIYMKSLAAEVAIEDLQISTLPLTFSKNETIDLQLNTPKSICDGNALVTEQFLESRNTTPCSINMPDCITSKPQEAVDVVNNLLSCYANKYLIFRYLECLCDTDLFESELYTKANPDITVSVDDMKLITWYVECAKIFRLSTISIINRILEEKKDKI